MAKTSKKQKGVTNEDLARMMQNEFSELQTEIRGGFSKNDQMHKLFIDRFDKVEADIKDIKANLGPLFRMVSMQEEEISDIRLRLAQVERKVGISK